MYIRIAREAEDHHLRLRRALADGALQLLEEVDIRRHAHRADVGAGDDGAVDVDRVRGIRHQHRIAAVQRGEHQVGEAFLRADGHHRLGFRVEIDVVAALVPVADRLAQARNALRHRIAVRVSRCAASTSLSTMCCGVGPSGLPMLMSMMSSPRRRAAIFSSPVMLKT
jgi:hypothetical protein